MNITRRRNVPVIKDRLDTLKRGERNPDEIEIDIIRKDGQTRHLQVFPPRGDSGII
jgi:hypothetical protein